MGCGGEFGELIKFNCFFCPPIDEKEKGSTCVNP